MAQMNISIPEKRKNWVEWRVAEGSFASGSDYIRDLVRCDQRKQEHVERLRAEIQAGFDSPVSGTGPVEQIEALRGNIRSKAAAGNAA